MRRPYAAMKENTEQLSSEEKQYRKMTEEPGVPVNYETGASDDN